MGTKYGVHPILADRRYSYKKSFPAEPMRRCLPDELAVARHKAVPVAGMSTGRVNAFIMTDQIGGPILQQIKRDLRAEGRLEGERRKAAKERGDFRNYRATHHLDDDWDNKAHDAAKDPLDQNHTKEAALDDFINKGGNLQGMLSSLESHRFIGDREAKNRPPRVDPASRQTAAGCESSKIMIGIRAFRGKEEILHPEAIKFCRPLEKHEEAEIMKGFRQRICPPRPNAITKSLSCSIVHQSQFKGNQLREPQDKSPRHMLPKDRSPRVWRDLDKRVTSPSGGDETPSEAWLDDNYVGAWKFHNPVDITDKNGANRNASSEDGNSSFGDTAKNLKALQAPRSAFLGRDGMEVKQFVRHRHDSEDPIIIYGGERTRSRHLEDIHVKLPSRALPRRSQCRSRGSTPRGSQASETSSLGRSRSAR